MANATSASARAGFQIFQSSGGTLDKEEINTALEKSGYSPISDRMFRHYRNLERAGFNRYISINRFDVARASEPYENLGANSRYKYVDTSVGARVTFPRGRQLVIGFGRAERIGETGLVLVFDDSETVAALKTEHKRPRLGETLRIEILDPKWQFDARVIDVEPSPNVVMVEVEYESLQSIATYIGRSPLPLSDYKFKIVAHAEAQTTVDVIGRQLYSLFEIVESSRSLFNEAAQLARGDHYAPVADVKKLEYRSPLQAVLALPDPVAAVIAASLGLLGVAITYQKFRRLRLENTSLEIKNDLDAAKAEYEKKKAELGSEVLTIIKTHLRFKRNPKEADLTTLLQLTSAIDDLSEQGVKGAELKGPQPKK